jgi:hypothetical protein
LKQHLIKNNQLANELTTKFLHLLGEHSDRSTPLFEREEGVERFRLIAGKVEVTYL